MTSTNKVASTRWWNRSFLKSSLKRNINFDNHSSKKEHLYKSLVEKSFYNHWSKKVKNRYIESVKEAVSLYLHHPSSNRTRWVPSQMTLSYNFLRGKRASQWVLGFSSYVGHCPQTHFFLTHSEFRDDWYNWEVGKGWEQRREAETRWS